MALTPHFGDGLLCHEDNASADNSVEQICAKFDGESHLIPNGYPSRGDKATNIWYGLLIDVHIMGRGVERRKVYIFDTSVLTEHYHQHENTRSY